MIIRNEQPADIPAIRQVVQSAFPQPFEAELIDKLRAENFNELSLVAVDGGKVIGHALFSRLNAPFKALGLAPVSVMPDRQRSGIGSQMIRAGLECAAKDGWEGVFVLGDPKYYQRFGFSPVLASGFISPYAGNHFMALALHDSLPVTEGRIDYAPPFAELE